MWEAEVNLHMGEIKTLHQDNASLVGSAYFGAMIQRKRETGTLGYFGAMHLDNQFH